MKYIIRSIVRVIVCLSIVVMACKNTSYFDGDDRKVLKIIHSNSGIVKTSDSTSSVEGRVMFEFRVGDTFCCEKAMYNYNSRKFIAFHIIKTPERLHIMPSTILHTESFVFSLSDSDFAYVSYPPL